MNGKKGFASDNNSGVHPEVLSAFSEVNIGHEVGYGDDKYTALVVEKFKAVFQCNMEVFFVFTGTAANVLGLKAMGDSYNAVVCANTAHLNVDECGAPEHFTGMKILPIDTKNGKITVSDISPLMHGVGFEHHVQPKIISITQPTELGTLYSSKEIADLANFVHKNNMYLHMDGARIANAVVALNEPIANFTHKAGVDVLSFGGTKNGLMFGEAILFFDTNLAKQFKYMRKQGMQLASKMRYLAAQFHAYFSNGLWLKNAGHANNMTQLLANRVNEIEGVHITQKVESNGVFAIIPRQVIKLLQQEYFFYVWDEQTDEVRWMCSFDTTEKDVEQFSQTLKKLIKEHV